MRPVKEKYLKKEGMNTRNFVKNKSHNENLKMPLQNNVIMMKCAVPKKATLPGERVFHAKYQRVKRANLPPNFPVQRTYCKRQGGKRKQRGKGCKSSIKKVVKKYIVWGKEQLLSMSVKS